jgi:hypothetical protein
MIAASPTSCAGAGICGKWTFRFPAGFVDRYEGRFRDIQLPLPIA